MADPDLYWWDISKVGQLFMLISDFVSYVRTMESLTLNHVIDTTNWHLTVIAKYQRLRSQFQ